MSAKQPKIYIKGSPVTEKFGVLQSFAMFMSLLLLQGGACNSNVNKTCASTTYAHGKISLVKIVTPRSGQIAQLIITKMSIQTSINAL